MRQSDPSVPRGVSVSSLGVDAEVTEEELLRRKNFLQFGDDDVDNLVGIHNLALQNVKSLIGDFYEHLLSFEETRIFFEDPEVLKRVQNAQEEYFLRLTQGNYDPAYAQNRLRIGAIHERIGLPVKAYLGMYNYYLRAMASRLIEEYESEPKRAWSAFISLLKLKMLDIGLAIDTYISARERTIREQQEAIQELPIPVLPFREGMLLVPIIGLIDSLRARLFTEQLLAAVRDNRAKVVVIDITGVQAVDSKVANHIVQTVEAPVLPCRGCGSPPPWPRTPLSTSRSAAPTLRLGTRTGLRGTILRTSHRGWTWATPAWRITTARRAA